LPKTVAVINTFIGHRKGNHKGLPLHEICMQIRCPAVVGVLTNN
jgi:hypothetical protein